MRITETLGTLCGIVGAVLVATKHGDMGYPFFLASSVLLLGSAVRQRQGNFIALQAVYFATNLIGAYNYVF